MSQGIPPRAGWLVSASRAAGLATGKAAPRHPTRVSGAEVLVPPQCGSKMRQRGSFKKLAPAGVMPSGTLRPRGHPHAAPRPDRVAPPRTPPSARKSPGSRPLASARLADCGEQVEIPDPVLRARRDPKAVAALEEAPRVTRGRRTGRAAEGIKSALTVCRGMRI